MAEQVKAADAPAPALSFGNFADKVASPSGGFNFKAPEFNTGNAGLFGAPTKFGETDKKGGRQEGRRRRTPRPRSPRGVHAGCAVGRGRGRRRRRTRAKFPDPRGPGVHGDFPPVVQFNEVEAKKDIERGVGEVDFLKHREKHGPRFDAAGTRAKKCGSSARGLRKLLKHRVVSRTGWSWVDGVMREATAYRPKISTQPRRRPAHRARAERRQRPVVGLERGTFPAGELEDTIFAIRFGNRTGPRSTRRPSRRRRRI